MRQVLPMPPAAEGGAISNSKSRTGQRIGVVIGRSSIPGILEKSLYLCRMETVIALLIKDYTYDLGQQLACTAKISENDIREALMKVPVGKIESLAHVRMGQDYLWIR